MVCQQLNIRFETTFTYSYSTKSEIYFSSIILYIFPLYRQYMPGLLGMNTIIKCPDEHPIKQFKKRKENKGWLNQNYGPNHPTSSAYSICGICINIVTMGIKLICN